MNIGSRNKDDGNEERTKQKRNKKSSGKYRLLHGFKVSTRYGPEAKTRDFLCGDRRGEAESKSIWPLSRQISCIKFIYLQLIFLRYQPWTLSLKLRLFPGTWPQLLSPGVKEHCGIQLVFHGSYLKQKQFDATFGVNQKIKGLLRRDGLSSSTSEPYRMKLGSCEPAYA